MIDKKLLKQQQDIQDKLYEAASELLTEINEIEPIESFDYLYPEDINEDYIEYYGEAHWRYGGYEEYHYELDSELLFNEEYKKEYIQNLKDKVNLQKKEKEEQELLKKQKFEEKERLEYERLKSKFEN